MKLHAGDIVFAQSKGLVGGAIRWFTRLPGEEKTQVNHVGVMADAENIVEALARTVKRPLAEGYAGKVVAIYRLRDLPAAQAAIVVAKAESYIGRKYGVLKVVAHAIDRFLGGRYIARRITRMDRYPMCSWLAEKSYMAIAPWLVARALCEAGRTFGVPDGSADPDHIWDWVTKHPQHWECVWPLGRLE